MPSVTETNIFVLGKQGERLFSVDKESQSESVFLSLTWNR
jgi:hypothetical protein